VPCDEDFARRLEVAFTGNLREALEAGRRRGRRSPLGEREEGDLIERRGRVFREDWLRAAARENERRRRFGPACAGARILLGSGPEGHLAVVLRNLVDADSVLADSFLTFHERVVERRLGPIPGTAGGGVPYLRLSRDLLRYFPALLAFRVQLPQ
jgi:hypothetical protein